MINPNEFIIKELPSFHPMSMEYRNFWKVQKQRSVEGHWISGIYMPGKLYNYVNFGTIKLNKNLSKQKTYGQPSLRDIEWEVFYGLTVARGFSGFRDDPTYTCLDIIRDWETFPLDLQEEYKIAFPSAFHNDSPKIYVDPLEYIKRDHLVSKGPPLFHNQASNFMLMGPRGFGKSYMLGVGVVLPEFLFDGNLYYPIDASASTNILVGAGVSRFSNETLSKTKEAFDRLPGSTTINGVTYPPPFHKTTKGSLAIGSKFVHSYKKKIGNMWQTLGTKSGIQHVSYDSPFAGIGTRNSISLVEEIGMCDDLLDIHANNVDTLKDDLNKFGTEIYIGTGGDMESGTLGAYDMFYNPPKYSILPYNDTWEHRGKIGFFLPATHGLSEHHGIKLKDEFGNTKVELAKKLLLAERAALQNQKGGSEALNKFIQYRPMVPSEIFLSKAANIFPSAELKRRLTQIEQEELYEKTALQVELYFSPTSKYNGVDYSVDTNSKLSPVVSFPLNDNASREGCVTIYELPNLFNGSTPSDAYIIGHDPYKSDDPSGGSLASIYVVKTKKYFSENGNDEIVASFIGRPYAGRQVVNEILLKLSLFYGNAKVYFENAVGNVKEYFEKTSHLHLLATQPTTILNKKASFTTNPTLIYGYPMSNQVIKREAIAYLRDWLLEEHHTEGATTYRNLDLINDPGLIKELLAFDFEVNTDRVMGLAGAIIGLNETQNQFKNSFYEDPSPTLAFLNNNIKLFKPNANIPAAAPILSR